MDAFDAPDADPSAAPTVDDEPPTLGPLAYLGAAGNLIGGLIALTQGLQLLVLFRPSTLTLILGLLVAGLGLGQVICGGMTFRGRFLPAVLGAGFAGLAAVVAFGWVIVSLLSGVFALLAFVWLLAAVPIAALSVLPVGPSQRLTAWRRALLEEPD